MLRGFFAVLAIVLLVSCSSSTHHSTALPPATSGPAGTLAPGTTVAAPPTTAPAPASTSTSTSTSVPSATPTVVNYYMAWAGTRLLASVQVTQTAQGSCFSASIAADRADAWRCSVGNDLYDPCFSPIITTPAPTSVVCPQTPSLTNVLQIDLTSPLPLNMANIGNAGADPWLIVLGSGATCEAVTGATTTVDGQRNSYECSDKTALFGDPVDTKAVWTILSSASEDAGPLTSIPIARALQ